MKPAFSIGDLFQFDRMVAPTVLKIVYWLGLIGIGIYMLVAIGGAFAMMEYSATTALGTMIVALIAGAFGLLFWRIIIEVYMVLFGIHERLGEVRDLMRKDD